MGTAFGFDFIDKEVRMDNVISKAFSKLKGDRLKMAKWLLVGQSASLATCYALCFVPCVIAEGSAAKCALICVRKCLVKPSSIDLQKDTHHSYFCKVGCATSLCTNLSTKEDPGLLAGQSASFKINLCYPKCIIPCVLIKHSAIECAQICKDKCKSEPSFMDLYKDTHYFCNVGCVTSMCTNLSTEEDPAEENLKGCVNSCSETCTKK
ncbi:hypothetical protein Ddye_011232 [Dipteronia dyeriana]|uniref:Uncharacterized protein n=1 Tax=Dipteronia dyeriana TaxID=168575 RepID=A0AAD9X1S3_9ROSI|nr:hypothetical protein Ddye_011232 [Dipteronia dyeriana]